MEADGCRMYSARQKLTWESYLVTFADEYGAAITLRHGIAGIDAHPRMGHMTSGVIARAGER